jgi:hypothetical protein
MCVSFIHLPSISFILWNCPGILINATEEEEEEEERGAVLRGKNLHAHFLLIARFLLVSATAMANPEIDDSLSFCYSNR